VRIPIRTLAVAATDNALLAPELAAGIRLREDQGLYQQVAAPKSYRGSYSAGRLKKSVYWSNACSFSSTKD
jgi:hypothetical protein